MARSKKPKAVPAGTVSTHNDGQVEVRKVDTRRLYTVEPDRSEWLHTERVLGVGPKEFFEGAIVRLRPPATATDVDVDRVRTFYEKAGAAKVSVLPRPKADVIPQDVQQAPAKAVGAREAVLSLVEESNTKDRDGLRAFCERVMAECGL